MKRIKNRKELEGKTIAKVTTDYGEYLCLYFTDGQYCVMYAGDDDIQLDATMYPNKEFSLGIITDEEHAQYMEKQRLERAQRQDLLDRVVYEKLKAKFECKS